MNMVEGSEVLVERVQDLLEDNCVALVVGQELRVATVKSSEGDWYTVTRQPGGMTCECPAAKSNAVCSHVVAAGVRMVEWAEHEAEWAQPFGPDGRG